MKQIPYGRQYIDGADIKSVQIALKKEKITTGESVLKLEKNISRYVGSKYASSCSSGTAALHLAFECFN